MNRREIFEAAALLSKWTEHLRLKVIYSLGELEDILCNRNRVAADPNALMWARMAVRDISEAIDEEMYACDKLRVSLGYPGRYKIFFDILDAPKGTAGQIARLLHPEKNRTA
jgi:hypothetical protein